jgi:[ribosomal protein S18]-alanine N-acetyltransferase
VTAPHGLGERVRRAAAGDADAVVALEAETFGADAWPYARVVRVLTHPRREAWVAVDGGGGVCGYVVLSGVAEVADLERIAVATSHRQRGLAAMLLASCDLSGCDRVMLEVRADNEAAVAFYRREGFAEISRRRGYYADGADAVVMERAVGAAAHG